MFAPLPLHQEIATSSGTAEQRIAENDEFQVNDLDWTVRVAANGEVSMPMIGKVVAAGLTIPEFERALEPRYNVNLLQNSSISVFMKESAGMRVSTSQEIGQ